MSGSLPSALAQCPEHACQLGGLRECSNNVSGLGCWEGLLTIWNQEEALHDASQGAKTDLVGGGKFRELSQKPFHLQTGDSITVPILLKPGLENFEHYFTSV